MLKFLGKLMWWRQAKEPSVTVHDYGRYVYKPVLQRTLSEVMKMSQTELVNRMMNDGMEVYLNDGLLHPTHLVLRLESGTYEIKVPSLRKVWRFFIA